MRKKRLIAGFVTVATLAAGAAGAVAATNEKAAEQQVLSGAAKRLGVSSGELRAALVAAEDAQLDAAVEAGELTQAQADRIKEHRRADGTILRLAPGRHHGSPGGRHGGGGRLLDDAASALGISREQLFEQLEGGRTLGEIAEAEGQSVAQVKAAIETAVTKRLDADLKAGRVTEAQHTEMVEHLAEHLDRLDADTAFRRHGPHRHTPGTAPRDDGSSNEGAVFRSA